MSTKTLLETITADPELIEVGRKAIEDVLVEFRDRRISEPFRGNGLVIREKDGQLSKVVRFGPEFALTVGLQAINRKIQAGYKFQSEEKI